jgi:hypothetical protein
MLKDILVDPPFNSIQIFFLSNFYLLHFHIVIGFFILNALFGMIERKWEEKKLQKLINKFRLILVGIAD